MTLIQQIVSHIPRRLPVGATEFNKFSTRILSQSGRFADEDSMNFALASILIHADARFGYLPDRYFINRLIKSAANQVASQVFQDIKNKQIAAQESAKAEELAKQQAEATALQEVANVEVLPNEKV